MLFGWIVQYDGAVSLNLCAWRHYIVQWRMGWVRWTVDTMPAIDSLASESDVFVGMLVGTLVGSYDTRWGSKILFQN